MPAWTYAPDEPPGGGSRADDPASRDTESVLLLTPVWERDGGIATHVATSAAALAERGLRVDVLVGRVGSLEVPAGVTVHGSPRLLDPAAPARERLAPVAELRPSVAHIHQVDDPELVAELRRRSAVAMSMHGYLACTSGDYYFRPGRECTRGHGPMCLPNLALRGCAHMRNPRPLPASYRRATRTVQALRGCDLAISYSSAVDRHLAANDVARRRIVPLFVTVPTLPGAEAEDRPRVLFAGRVVPSKGLAVLIRAMSDVPAELVVCGEGWQLDSMRRLAARLGAAQRIDFRGWLAPERLADELARCSLLAMPSVWPEPFGLVGIEALAAGRPVVASATGGIPDWLADGVSGLLCAPGSPRALAGALGELLADPERRRRMGEAGRRSVAERFTAEHHVRGILDAYAAARSHWREHAPAPAPSS